MSNARSYEPKWALATSPFAFQLKIHFKSEQSHEGSKVPTGPTKSYYLNIVGHPCHGRFSQRAQVEIQKVP
jgi:hypothetical protein